VLTLDGRPADKKTMPPVLAVLFWVWLLVSIVVIVRRRAAKRSAAAVGEGDDILDPVTTPAADPVGAETPVAASVGAAPAPPPVAPAPLTPPPGFDLPQAPLADRPVHRSAPAAGVADALVGIRMPCDLVPLVLDRLATDHITLSTTGHPAEEVGQALADEVERLGYVLRPTSDHEVLATRGATELRLVIRPPDADGRQPAHPNARENSVVVEISIG
jgi:hypothetical protein